MQLEDIAGTESVEPLIDVLNDADAVVRRLAIGLLEELGDARAVPAIIERLLDSDYQRARSGQRGAARLPRPRGGHRP